MDAKNRISPMGVSGGVSRVYSMSTFRNFAAALVFASVPFTALVPAFAQDAGDPPDSVARIAETSGTVSFHPAGSQEWQAAQQNYPVTAGSGVWAEPRSHASVDINGARIHLDGGSDLEITTMSPQGAQLSVPQGAVFVHVYPGAAGQSFEVDTPRGAAHINQPGQYEIEAGDDQHPMTLSVFEGSAQLVGQSANMALQPGQRGLINPDSSSSTAAVEPDDFVRAVQAAEQPYQNTQQTAQYVSPSEPGYQDLQRYGQWSQAPQYGAVWYPQQVAADWAPYRYGHWAYVAPWGYTWVDDAPWGFTPFHYGRWVQIGGRWGWCPGERVERPVYAPALVTFFGNIGGIGIDLSVGWVPLAPEEVYVPPYRHSPRYVRDINIVNVHNETKIVNVVNNVTVINYNNYANRRAATVVDRQTLAEAHPVAAAFRRQPKVDEQHWAHAQAVQQIAVQPQAKERPGNAPKFDAHQTSNAQFAAQEHNSQGKPQGQPQGQAQGQAQGQTQGQTMGQPQGKSKSWNGNNAQFAAQPNTSSKQQQGQFQPSQTQQYQGQPNAQNQTSKKTKKAAPGPIILPPNATGTANGAQPQPQWMTKQGQNGQTASQSPAAQKTWKSGQVPTPPVTASGTAPATPAWKQNQGKPSGYPAVIPNQLPASIQNNAAPSPTTDQKHKQKNTNRNTQQPQMPQPTPQPQFIPQVNQPAAQQSQKPNKTWQQNGQFQNGGQQNQSKHTNQQQIPQFQAKPQGLPQIQQGGQPQGQPTGKAQNHKNKQQNQGCNPQTGAACTQ